MKNVEEIREYCLSKYLVTEDMPFGEETLVFRIKDKIFALLSLSGECSINLKCDPEMAIELREKYNYVIPGYHMNKKHWNTIEITNQTSGEHLKQWIDHSYNLIVSKLSKKDRESLNQ